MRRLAAAAALALAMLAGVAHADTFTVLPSSLPSAETPNRPGSLVLPRAWTEHATRPQRLSAQRLERLWRQAGAAYGIPWEVLAAINEIESNFGRNMGPSSAGAVGWMQFMPDTWLRWGMDGNGDGVADPWNAEDAVFAAARYLAAAGGRTDLRRGIFAYNHADWYVADVLRLAALYGDGARGSSYAGGGGASLGEGALVDGSSGAAAGHVLFSLDRPQATLAEAGREVAVATDRVTQAVGVERALARAEARLDRRSERTELLSERLALEKRVAQVGAWRDAARQRVKKLRAALDARRAVLRRAQAAGTNALVTGTVSGTSLTASPRGAVGGYVFPVGGGPDLVSVSQAHHDYPAADIAAPMGSPVYALASATVVSAWHASDGRCGIGLTLKTADGQTWTYCHLSYLDPRVDGGTTLTPGARVGLVGSTGNSTGPHLHLQLQPAASYPQDQAWFRSFAGSAFRWQDGEPTRPVIGGSAAAFAPAQRGPQPGDVITFTR